MPLTTGYQVAVWSGREIDEDGLGLEQPGHAVGSQNLTQRLVSSSFDPVRKAETDCFSCSADGFGHEAAYSPPTGRVSSPPAHQHKLLGGSYGRQVSDSLQLNA